MPAQSVTPPVELGGSGATYSNDASPTTGMANGGYLARFFPLIADVIAMAWTAVQAAADAVAARNAAQAVAVVTSSSTSSVALASSGSAVFTIDAGKPINASMYFRASSRANPTTHWVEGYSESYAGTTLTLGLVAKGSGTGSRADWDISLAPTGVSAVSQGRQVATSGLATGGGDLSADRTINVPAASAAEVKAGASTTKAMTPKSLLDAAAFVALVDGATINHDAAALGQKVKVTIAGNRTFAAPTNLSDGVDYVYAIKQDATGGRQAAWNAVFDWGEDGPPSLSTGPDKVDYAYGLYNADRGKLEMAFRKAAA